MNAQFFRTVIIAASVGVIAMTGVQAQQGGTQAEREACTPDVYKFCEAFIPDEKSIVACLKKNVKKLSPACAKVIG